MAVAKPSSLMTTAEAVVQLIMKLGALCVLGNHDFDVLCCSVSEKTAGIEGNNRRIRAASRRTLNQGLSSTSLQFLRDLPHAIRVPELNLLVVHGGLAGDDGLLSSQSSIDLMMTRHHLSCSSPLRLPQPHSWAACCQGEELVVFGHDAPRGLHIERRAIGLDTGCCGSGVLTALILPDRVVVQTKDKKKKKTTNEMKSKL